jgi:tRNA-dihydrouridine synthase B
MREPAHAAEVIGAMARAVKIPVTVKMRAGWNDKFRNAPDLARRVQDAGAAAVTIHGRTAEQSYTGEADWELVAQVADSLEIPVLGSGDCIEPEDIITRMNCGVSGVLVGRGVLRNPWILSQAADLAAGRTPRAISLVERGQFLLKYIDMLLGEGINEREGFRHSAVPGSRISDPGARPSSSRERWVINKLRALCAWYSKGIDRGSHLRVQVNGATSIQQLRELIDEFFFQPAAVS